MKIPLENLIENYITVLAEDSQWITNELRKLTKESDPTMCKAVELYSRGQRNLREAGIIKFLLDDLDGMCVLLEIDIESLMVDDQL